MIVVCFVGVLTRMPIITEQAYVERTSNDGENIQTVYSASDDIPEESQVYDDEGILQRIEKYVDGEINTVKEYDEEGNMIALTGYSDGIEQTTTEYNGETITAVVTRDEEGTVISREEYDSKGNTVADEVYENGVRITRNVYDTAGNLTKKLNYEDNVKVSTEVWEDDALVSTTYFEADGDVTTKDTYDANGNTISTGTWKDGAKQSLENYDAKGTLTEVRTYTNGVRTGYESYDNGILTKKNTYDSSGNLTRMNKYTDDGEYVHYQYNYESNGEYTKTYYLDGDKIYTEYYTYDDNKDLKRTKVVAHVKSTKDEGYKNATRDTCDLSGSRNANSVVDVGFDSDYANRTYYAYTDSKGRIKKVEAAVIIRQAQNVEPTVLSSNGKFDELRYCSDEAKVTGATGEYDEGHVIADSLGGASNAYNITPELEDINLYGGQYKMEDEIRKAIKSGSVVTNFTMKISYPNSSTNIPSKYSATYYIDGVKQTQTFENSL